MTSTPCPSNPLGIKGLRRSRRHRAPAAVINAITDALGHEEVAMPATPLTVWRAANSRQCKSWPRNSASTEEPIMYAFDYHRPQLGCRGRQAAG